MVWQRKGEGVTSTRPKLTYVLLILPFPLAVELLLIFVSLPIHPRIYSRKCGTSKPGLEHLPSTSMYSFRPSGVLLASFPAFPRHVSVPLVNGFHFSRRPHDDLRLLIHILSPLPLLPAPLLSLLLRYFSMHAYTPNSRTHLAV